MQTCIGKLIVGLALLGAVATASAGSEPSLGPDGNYYQVFQFTGDDHTWAAAYAAAQAQTFTLGEVTYNGFLAPVATAAVKAFADGLVDAGPGSWGIVWNGDYVNDGTLYAGAGKPLGTASDISWITWSTGWKPSRTIGSPDNYGVLSTGGGYSHEWQAATPSQSGIGQYLVEFGTASVPEPSQIISLLTLSAVGGVGAVARFRRRK